MLNPLVALSQLDSDAYRVRCKRQAAKFQLLLWGVHNSHYGGVKHVGYSQANENAPCLLANGLCAEQFNSWTCAVLCAQLFNSVQPTLITQCDKPLFCSGSVAGAYGTQLW